MVIDKVGVGHLDNLLRVVISEGERRGDSIGYDVGDIVGTQRPAETHERGLVCCADFRFWDSSNAATRRS
jgi:hypothetical protein